MATAKQLERESLLQTKKAQSKRIRKGSKQRSGKFQIQNSLKLMIQYDERRKDRHFTAQEGLNLNGGPGSQADLHHQHDEMKTLLIMPECESQYENYTKRTFICAFNMFNHYK